MDSFNSRAHTLGRSCGLSKFITSVAWMCCFVPRIDGLPRFSHGQTSVR